MRRTEALSIAAAAFLACLAAVLASRVIEHVPASRLEVGRERLSRLDEASRARLARLEHRVFITWYLTRAARMPASMRGLERRVVNLLAAMRSSSNGRLDYQVVDPDTSPELEAYAARRQVAPYRVRDIRGDSWTEQSVWSTITVEYGSGRPVAFHGVGPEHLPFLQSALLGTLDHLETPRAPVFVVAAPSGFDGLRAALDHRGEVLEVNPAGAGAGGPDPWLPAGADALFWMDPEEVAPERVLEVERFLASGGSVVLAASRVDGAPVALPGGPGVRIQQLSYGAESVFLELGLEPADGLVLDAGAGELADGEPSHPAPFLVRPTAYEQDFRNLSGQPNGSLLFAFPTPLLPQHDRLARRGLTPELLVTTSEATWMPDLPGSEQALPLDAFDPGAGRRTPKLPLAVLLRPASPRHGLFVALAASTPFADGALEQPGHAHRRLLDILADTVAGEERLVLARAAGTPPPPLPRLDASTRLILRLGVVLLGPSVLLLVVAVNRRRGRAIRPGASRPADAGSTAVPSDQPGSGASVARGRTLGPAFQAAGVLAAVLAGVWAAGTRGCALDLTADGLHTPAAATLDALRRATVTGPLQADLYLSGTDRLPPELRLSARRLEAMLATLGRKGQAIAVRRTRPEELDEEGRRVLEASGVSPARMATADEDRTVVQNFHATLVLSAGDRREVLAFPDLFSFEDLEFRLAFAFHRLATGRRPHVGLASDVPRLTPAEAHENYQTKGLVAPSGTDPYARARALIQGRDFRVTHIDPGNPGVPDDLDALVWLQPRTPAAPMLYEAVRALRSGIPVFIAAQHFNMQSRQYPGRQFRTVYWPQPQWPELEGEGFYLPELGVVLVREVLFDRLSTRMQAPSQVHRGGRIEYERMESALPFVLRAASAHYLDSHPVMRGLGDQVFPWAAWIEVDQRRLAARGLTATVLATTSSETWSYAWQGGWIPEERIQGPPVGGDGAPDWTGRKPLAVLVEGVFPSWLPPERERDRLDDAAPLDGAAPARPSKLLLLGSSEVFKDHRIVEPEADIFRGDHLLLNAVAWLALGDDLGSVMSRRAVPRGFGLVTSGERAFWRAAAPATVPLVLVAFELIRARRRRSGGLVKSPARTAPADAQFRPSGAATRWTRRAAVAVAVLAAADLVWARAERTGREPAGRLGALVPVSEREDLSVAVIRVVGGGLGEHLYVREGGLWRSATWRNALARPVAVEGLLRALLDAQGHAYATVRELDGKLGLDAGAPTLLSLHGPRYGQDRRRDERFALDVGKSAAAGGSYVRRLGSSVVWRVDRDLRAALGSPPAPGVPSLIDSAVVPEAWWVGAGATLERMEVNALDGASWSMVLRERPLTPEQLAARESPWAWYLLDDAATERVVPPQRAAAWVDFLRQARWADVLDARQVPLLLGRPEAARLTLVASDGESASWVLLGAAQTGAPLILDAFHRAAYRVSPEVASRLFPRGHEVLAPAPGRGF